MPYPLPPRPHGLPHPAIDRASADPQSRDTIEAQRAWARHVAAGRIGVPAPPPQGTGDFGCAGLEAILARVARHRGRRA